MNKLLSAITCAGLFAVGVAKPQAPVRLSLGAISHEYAIPNDFAGLGFETKSVLPDTYRVSGYFFTPDNVPLITLFKNMGIRNIRVGGGTVDGSGTSEHCVSGTPTHQDIDKLFEFARAANIKVIYSVRLLNLSACADPNLPMEDASIVAYIWSKYRDVLDNFSIGNEPDVRQYHTYPGHEEDPLIVEAVPGTAGSAYPSYFAEWRKYANVILKSVPAAKFSGPDTAVSDRSSYTPNSSVGVSWTEQFSHDLKKSGILAEALQHHYVWGRPGDTTVQQAIDNMLSKSWVEDTSIGSQPSGSGRLAFQPYPYLYRQNFAKLVSEGVAYRMTEANDCLHGVVGASNGFASALWALDYMHWWAAHRMAGVNFHNNPWIPTDTVFPDPNPCGASGCGNYKISPKGYGIKAFDLGSHGFVQPIAIANQKKINVTAYAVGTDADLYVTIINKTHSTTADEIDADVVVQSKGFETANVSTMELAGDQPGNAASMTVTLGGASISNDAPWAGTWTPLGRVANGNVSVTVHSATAVIVWIHATGAPSSRPFSGRSRIESDVPGRR